MRLAAAVLCLPLAGCSAEPLAPAFAGRWEPVSEKRACAGATLGLERDGISGSGGGFPLGLTILPIVRAEIRGASADLLIRLGDPTAGGVLAFAAAQSGMPVPEIDIAMTLRAQGDRVFPSNIIFRDRRTGSLHADPRAARDLSRFLTLRRCPG